MAGKAAQREKIDWGVLLDEAWGHESQDESRPCLKLLGCENQTESSAVVGRTDVTATASQTRYRDAPSRRESRDLDSSLLLTEFSPCLLSHTSTPRKTDDPKNDTSSVHFKNGHPEFKSNRPGKCIGNCAVLVTKCTLSSAACRSPQYSPENPKHVQQHKCGGSHLHETGCVMSPRDKAGNKTLSTEKVSITDCEKMKLYGNVVPDTPNISSHGQCFHTSMITQTSPSTYMSPLLFPDPTTPSTTLSSPLHTTSHGPTLCSLAGCKDISTATACTTLYDTRGATNAPPPVFEGYGGNRKCKVSNDSLSSDTFIPENPLTVSDSQTSSSGHCVSVNYCNGQRTDATSLDTLYSLTTSSSLSKMNEGGTSLGKCSVKLSNTLTDGLCTPEPRSDSISDSQTSSTSQLHPLSISLSTCTTNCSQTASSLCISTPSTPLTALLTNSNQSTPVETTLLTACSSNHQTSTNSLNVTSTESIFQRSLLLATPTNTVTTPTCSSNQSTPLTESSSCHSMLIATPRMMSSLKTPLLEIPQNYTLSAGRDSTPAMQPGITTGKTARGRRLVLVPYSTEWYVHNTCTCVYTYTMCMYMYMHTTLYMYILCMYMFMYMYITCILLVQD